MSIWMRRARVRGLKEGSVQKARAEGLENQAHDDAERFQDYGFAGHAVDGQGLVLHVGGHTVVMRMDRLAERPQLAPLEVCVWHREGHRITLKAGKKIVIEGAALEIQMSEAVDIKSPALRHNGVNVGSPHTHGGVATGSDSTTPPNN